MSEAKKAHIHRYYEAVDAADVEGVLDIFTPDATYRRPGYPDIVGADALRASTRVSASSRAGATASTRSCSRATRASSAARSRAC